jgi:hypothetical protein
MVVSVDQVRADVAVCVQPDDLHNPLARQGRTKAYRDSCTRQHRHRHRTERQPTAKRTVTWSAARSIESSVPPNHSREQLGILGAISVSPARLR